MVLENKSMAIVERAPSQDIPKADECTDKRMNTLESGMFAIHWDLLSVSLQIFQFLKEYSTAYCDIIFGT